MGTMSRIIEDADNMSTFAQYYQESQTDAVIGYNGMGAVDFSKSDFYEPDPNAAGAGTEFAFHHLREDVEHPKVFLRRAVKFAELYCLSRYQGFILSEALFNRFEALFRQSLTAIQPCTAIRFGKHQVSKPYIYGRPKCPNLLKSRVDFNNSVFDVVDPYFFPVSQRKKERGRVPLDSPYPVLREGVKFRDFEEIRRFPQPNRMATAKCLHLKLQQLPSIISLSVSATYFCEEIALFLRDQKSPGTAFVGPPITVCGASTFSNDDT